MRLRLSLGGCGAADFLAHTEIWRDFYGAEYHAGATESRGRRPKVVVEGERKPGPGGDMRTEGR